MIKVQGKQGNEIITQVFWGETCEKILVHKSQIFMVLK